jgi:alkylation response protein AidB-like acyl-CoA dehydrogenase
LVSSFVLLLKEKNILSIFSGMAMTEKQGGSDVRANTTKAYCDNADEKRYILIGHK